MPGLFFGPANRTVAPAMTHESESGSSARGNMNGEISQRPSEQLVNRVINRFAHLPPCQKDYRGRVIRDRPRGNLAPTSRKAPPEGNHEVVDSVNRCDGRAGVAG